MGQGPTHPLSVPEDLVDRPVGDRHHEEVAVWTGLDVGEHTEVPADEQALALRNVVLGRVVRDLVRETRIIRRDLLTVAGELEPEEVTTGGQRGRGADEQVALELRAERAAREES